MLCVYVCCVCVCGCGMCVYVCDVCYVHVCDVCVCECVCVPLHTINTPLVDMGIRQRRDNYHGTLTRELSGSLEFLGKITS